ncbi:MAG TPA: Ig-like domain-containing protein, partial [Candidatus Angelobacter sp.]|nr:Ig-like domain-containing protein [Candidatus Angelobacter sp.]
SFSVNNSTPTNPPPASATNDVVWVNDAVPTGAWTGADYGDSWNWVGGNPTPYSGALAHQSALVTGVHSHYFSGATATLPVSIGDKMFTYVYLDPASPPQEVMLMWSDGASWSHAAYWGANLIQWGANGTASQYPAGALPAAGQWVRLEVPASLVALEGSAVSGMQFVLYDGRATFDLSGKSSQTAASDATPPTVSMTAPANGATVSGSSVAVTANASDNVGVSSVQFKLDGANLGVPFRTAPYNLGWDSTAVADGSHSLTAVATDAAGNQATATLAMVTVSNSSVVTNLSYATLPSWVGAATHNWKPRLGGVYWLDSLAVVKQAAPYLQQSSRPVLVDIKTDATGFGYRFDLNSWDAKSAIHSYYSWDGTDSGTPASPEDAMNIFGATGNAEFILNIPIPLFLTNSPSSNWGYDGFGYTWQTAQFYAAMTQYLVGTAGPQSEWQSLPTTLDFFSQPASFNWANLRARRGHLAPYPVVAFIIGSEPYNIEGTSNGSLYGPQAEKFRVAIRNRGVSAPLGLHVHDMGYVDDPQRLWFWPMMSAVTASDFSFMDLEHYYQFSSVQEDFKRTFPVSINPNAAYWMPKSSWKSDYTKFLWIVEDTRNAIRDDNAVVGLGNPGRWQLGFSEHGIQVTSQFTYNDMFSAMHWAGWLAESMRQNVAWDSGWTLVAEGFSHGQLQVRDGYVTRTPMFFVYQMAQEFYGYDCLTNNYSSAMGSTTDNIGNPVQFPWTTVRTFRDPATGNIHLFVLNQSLTDTATISGFENWNIISWKQLKGTSYSDSNPLGVAGAEPVQTVAVPLPSAGLPLAIAPVSVNHIVLAGSIDTGTPVPDIIAPAVSISAPVNGATVSGSSVTVSANATDNVGVTGVQFKLDGADLGGEDTSAPYGVTLNTTTLTDGAHTLSAVARDAAGNQTTAAAISVTISNSAPASTPTVSITSNDATATEGVSDTASFTLTRTGSTATDLIVTLQSTGTATKWDDYRRPVEGDMPDAWTIPAGASSVTITIVAVDDTLVEGPETATLTIQPGTNYNVGTSNSVTLTLLDNDSGTVPSNPTVTVVANDANASRVGPDNGAITIVRTGDTTSALTVNYSLGGTAVNGTDYAMVSTSVTIPAGASSAVITVVPKTATSYVGAKTMTITLSVNAAYTIGSANSASVTIAGNNVPVTSLRKAPANGGMVITWSSQAGKTYRVADKSSLTDPWVDLSGNITAAGPSTSWTDTTAGASKQRFYAVYGTN